VKIEHFWRLGYDKSIKSIRGVYNQHRFKSPKSPRGFIMKVEEIGRFNQSKSIKSIRGAV
jgi:hypothetical protein